MAKGTMRGLPGPEDPMYREAWSISFVGVPRRRGAEAAGEGAQGSQGATSPTIEGPQAEKEEGDNS